jgi:hypothetical protein
MLNDFTLFRGCRQRLAESQKFTQKLIQHGIEYHTFILEIKIKYVLEPGDAPNINVTS